MEHIQEPDGTAAGEPRLGLDELSWIDVAAHLARDPRLIVPIGALDQHGPHLPLASNVLIANRVAMDISREFTILRAPPIYYGVNASTAVAYAGTATLRQKTLHRALNELLGSWEAHGITEFILLTAHRYEPHLDVLATLLTERARVRVVSFWDIDVSDLLQSQPGPLHGGEAETSVMLYLYPDLVRMDRARDFELTPKVLQRYMHGQIPVPAPGGPGVIGRPTLASTAKGENIYRRVLGAIRTAVFLDAAALETDTV